MNQAKSFLYAPHSIGLLCVLLTAVPATVQAQNGPGKQNDNSLGTTPLPKGPPPTNPQGSVPPALLPLPPAEQSFRKSLSAEQVAQLVRGRTLTIKEAVAIALATNRDLATAVAALQSARGKTNEAKAAFAPQVGVSADITEYDEDTTITFFGLSIRQVNQFNPIYTGQISLPLDIDGSIRDAVSQAQFNEVAARIDINRARNSAIFNVRSAFYQALRAQAAYAVAVENLDNAETRYSDASKGLAAGLSSRFDVITAQRDVADAQQGVVNAEGEVSSALGQLKETIGIDVSAPLKISDAGAVETPPGVSPVVLPASNGPIELSGGSGPTASPIERSDGLGVPANQNPEPIGESNVVMKNNPTVDVHSAQDLVSFGSDYTAAVAEALATRPEILESDARIAAANKGVRYARRTERPNVQLQFQYIYQPNATVFFRSHQDAAALMVTVPLYDGGIGAARAQAAKAEAASAQTQRRDAVDQVTLDVQQAYISLTQARDRVQVTEAEVAQAREAFRLARVRARAGITQTPTVSPQLELSNAQTGLTVAETNRLNALYDYNVARSQLDRAVGRYSYGPGSGGYAAVPKASVVGRSR